MSKQECCGNPLRGCAECTPRKLTFEEWAVTNGYGYWYAQNKMQWSAGSRWPEELLRGVWQAAQENMPNVSKKKIPAILRKGEE